MILNEEYRKRARESKRKYDRKHRKQIRAYNRKYHQEHKEQDNIRRRKYHLEHREEGIAQQKRYRQENMEKVRIRLRKYRREHPEKVRDFKARKRARKLGAPGSHTATEVEFLRNISGGFCQGYRKKPHYVGEDKLTVDHKVPLSGGGSDDVSNLQMLCGSCNSVKGVKI